MKNIGFDSQRRLRNGSPRFAFLAATATSRCGQARSRIRVPKRVRMQAPKRCRARRRPMAAPDGGASRWHQVWLNAAPCVGRYRIPWRDS